VKLFNSVCFEEDLFFFSLLNQRQRGSTKYCTLHTSTMSSMLGGDGPNAFLFGLMILFVFICIGVEHLGRVQVDRVLEGVSGRAPADRVG
jgi:hypothetical protein